MHLTIYINLFTPGVQIMETCNVVLTFESVEEIV